MISAHDAVNQLLEHYPHRTRESVDNDLDAEEVLFGYLEHQGVEEYDPINSDFPYHAALGRTADSEGHLILTSRYTYPDESGVSQDFTQARITVENLDQVLEENIINEDNILDAAGAELEDDKKTTTPEGRELRPDTVHCVVFYDRPVVSATEQTEYNSQVHEHAAMQSLSEPSIATAIINSGTTPDGGEFAGAQIDYWTRTIDGVTEEGLDYTELNWRNPGIV